MIQHIKFRQSPSFRAKCYSGQNLTFQSANVTLKIKSRSPKSNQLFLCVTMIEYIKFGQNPSFCAKMLDSCKKLKFQSANITLKMKSIYGPRREKTCFGGL